MPKARRETGVDLRHAAEILDDLWREVTTEAANNPGLKYVEDTSLTESIRLTINHQLVAYRFCLPIQLLGKMTNPALNALALQRGDGSDPRAWDARSLGSKVLCRFNSQQENILGTSQDPYVGKPMRQPAMFRDDRSKKDIPGWNILVGILQLVEDRNDPALTGKIFRQVLLEMFHRQQGLRFVYPIPPRISADDALTLARKFLDEKSGGDRALALAGALFDSIGGHFGLYSEVKRSRINASDESTGQIADLECLSNAGKLILAVEVKDRLLTLADIEGTIQKSRHREDLRSIFFTAPGVREEDKIAVTDRVNRAFTAGQNVFVFDFFELARPVLALGGEEIRVAFLKYVGEHLDAWNTQPSNRQAWQRLLENV